MGAGPLERPSVEEPGRVIASKYELVRLLGEGGMGRVWLAHNLALDTEVAIKLIQPELLSRESMERLLQEARASARLKHPSVVRVFDFGTDDGQPYIVMEVLNGDPLSSLLAKKGRLPATNAVALLLPVAGALLAAHARGVVHRDLKPENVVLTQDERGRVVPKVVDFGVARIEPSARTVSSHKTQAGVVGTPDYMSPEQARGRRDVDARSDVWAFAVLLYETITGARPFDGDNYNALLTAICEDQPKPTTEHLAGDAELWAIIQRGMTKDRDQRWQTMEEMGIALADWAAERGVLTDATGASLEHDWLAPRHSVLSSVPPPASGRLTPRRFTPAGTPRGSLATLDGAKPVSGPPPSTPLVSVAPRSPTPSELPALPSPRPAWVLPVAAVGLLVCGGAFVWLLRPASPAPPTPAAHAPVTQTAPGPPVVPSSAVEKSAPSASAPAPSASAAARVLQAGSASPRADERRGPAKAAPSAKPADTGAPKAAPKPPAIQDNPDF